jgi:DNA-binding NarL/FixJ family response regulator
MPGSGGISAANQIRELEPPPKILIFSMHSNPQLERISGMVSKVNADRDLLQAIGTILGGGEFFSSAPPARIASRTQSALSERKLG